MIRNAIAKVVRGMDLTEAESKTAMDEILMGSATPAQVGSFLTALRIKGETVDEITGAAQALRARTKRIRIGNHMVNLDRDEINVDEETILDTCDTAGRGTHTFNVSTAVALVVAGGGVKVAKHGFRTLSRHCGSADVLKALGVKLDINHASVEDCIREVGIGFLYSPLLYGAMKGPAFVRQEIGIRTLFNLLVPVINPANTNAQVMGVYDPKMTSRMAQALHRLGTTRAFVVCGEGTYDEISICGSTQISRLNGGDVTTFEFTPEQCGFKRAEPEAIHGGHARENARIILEILDGGKGPKRDVVLLNAAAAFMASGVEEGFTEGIERAAEAIDSGRAKEKLGAVISFTQDRGYLVRKELY